MYSINTTLIDTDLTDTRLTHADLTNIAFSSHKVKHAYVAKSNATNANTGQIYIVEIVNGESNKKSKL
jgi:hypothetical protein